MVKKALIIAAGNGSRLKRGENDIPKPLRRVGGIPLLKRIMLTAQQAGIKEFVIVVGYRKERIIEAVRSYDLDVKVEFVENKDWQKSNGLSVLAAEKVLHENFVLLMSDHIFQAETLRKFAKQPLGDQDVLLAIDNKLDQIFDMDDATVVQVEDNRIVAIAKELDQYTSVDTGMFLVSPALFTALREVSKDGDCSLSDGIRHLAAQKKAGTYDIGDAFWQDVDTKPALRHAEKLLLNDCRKSTDGFFSRHLNRPISLWITRWLTRTNLSAHHMTGITSLVGIASGVFMARGDYWNVLLGAFLFQWASILDGVDGEMSRLKFTSSKVGQWLDTISDNLSYVSFIIGLVIGTSRIAGPGVQLAGIFTLAGLGLCLLVSFTYLLRFTDSGSLLAIQKEIQTPERPTLGKRILSKISFLVKRDFFALFFLGLAAFGQSRAILWLCLIGTNAAWMVMLHMRFGLFRLSPTTKKIADPSAQ